jgi:hypothetical protein
MRKPALRSQPNKPEQACRIRLQTRMFHFAIIEERGMPNGTNVFISHSWDTTPLAEELTKALENEGIEVWVDFKDLRPGQRWKEELERAIDRLRVLSFC